MKAKLSVLLLGCLMLVVGPLAANAGTSPFIVQGESKGLLYASGGVGKDEQMQMDHMIKNYNVKMVFVEAPKDYVSGVKVKIEDHNGKELLTATSNGPWFLAKLPKGEYRVIASFRGHSETKNLKVAGGLETVEFFWKA